MKIETRTVPGGVTAARGWLDEARVVGESLTAIRRAGADVIITYFAKDVARGLGGR